MNTLNIYPKKIKEIYKNNILDSGIEKSPAKYHNSIILTSSIIAILTSILAFFLKIKIYYGLIAFIILNLFFYFKISIKASTRIKKMENVFPDVISLMASNLRSGVTIDKAFLLSARPEFNPIDKEILKTGKEIATGKDIIYSLKTMGERIHSEKISKVLLLIISGLKAGGNISDLLEQTSRNMKEKEIIEKKASSSILMYVIFIFFAVAVGAPILFALGSVLAEIIISLAAKMPDMASSQMSLPFTFSKVSISVNFIIYYSVIFITISDLISCFIIGLVNKGEGKAGLKLFIPLLVLSLGIFLITRTFLSKILLNAIA